MWWRAPSLAASGRGRPPPHRIDKDEFSAAELEKCGDALLRIARVDRHEVMASLHRSERSSHEQRRVACEDRERMLLRCVACKNIGGNRVRPAIEIGIGCSAHATRRAPRPLETPWPSPESERRSAPLDRYRSFPRRSPPQKPLDRKVHADPDERDDDDAGVQLFDAHRLQRQPDDRSDSRAGDRKLDGDRHE